MANIVTNGRLGFHKSAVLTLAATVALAGVVVLAKERPAQTPGQTVSRPTASERFEVVSIRQSAADSNVPVGGRGGAGGGGGPCSGSAPQMDPGRIVFSNNSVYTLVTFAYGLNCMPANQAGLVSGGPAWVRTVQWMIQATIPDAEELKGPQGILFPIPGRPVISDPKLQRMLQNLLADRFGLVLHRETKEVPVYELIVAKGGAKLQRHDEGPCLPKDPPKPGERPAPGLNLCVTSTEFGVVMQELFDRPVIDKTGLTGVFQFHITFDPGTVPTAPGVGAITSDPSGPFIFTALQEQLGLKLESARGPVEVLVIDSVSKPTEN